MQVKIHPVPFCAAILSALFVTACAAETQSGPAEVNEIIIKFRDSQNNSPKHDAIADVAARHGLAIKMTSESLSKAQIWRVSKPLTEAEARQLADDIQASNGNVEYASPNSTMHLSPLESVKRPVNEQ